MHCYYFRILLFYYTLHFYYKGKKNVKKTQEFNGKEIMDKNPRKHLEGFFFFLIYKFKFTLKHKHYQSIVPCVET